MTLKTRIGAALLAVSAAFSVSALASCGGGTPQKTKLEHVYDYTPVKLSRSLIENGFENIRYSDGRIYFTSYGEDEEGRWDQIFMSVDETGADLRKYDLGKTDESGESYIGNVYVLDGEIWFVENKWSWDEATQTSSSQYWLHQSDKDGGEKNVIDMTEYTRTADGDNGINSLLAADGTIYVLSGKRVITVRDGKVDKAYDISINGWLNSMFTDRSGNVWIIYYEDGGQGGTRCRKFDKNTGSLTDEANLPALVSNNIYSATSGPDHDVYFYTNTGFFGYDMGAADAVEICNWMNSDISANYISGASALSDGRLFVAPEVWSQLNGGTGDSVDAFYLMTSRPDEKNVEKYILTFGCVYLDGSVRSAISQFNRQSDEYRITVKDYSVYQSDDDWRAGYTRLNQDIISGNSPDIIYITDQMPYSSYAAKGVFADLNPYIDKDEEIEREDYLENILNSTSINGKLYSIIPTFTVSTLACKASLVKKALGTDQVTGINMEEFNKIIAQLPDARVFATYNREEFLNTITASLPEMYIDQDTGKCSFDSPDFISMLEFIKSMPEKSVYDEIDYDDYDESVWNDIEMMYINDEAIFNFGYIGQYSSYWQSKMGQFGGDMMYVGFPCASKDGARINAGMELAIGGTSKFKDQAWDFVKYFLKDEYQESMNWQIPLKKSALEKLADAALNPPKEGDEDYYYGQNTYWLGGQEIEIGVIDKAAVDYVNSYIASIGKYYRSDESIQSIITEETDAFFKGVKTAEECAKLIQNRVQTYVSEQR